MHLFVNKKHILSTIFVLFLLSAFFVFKNTLAQKTQKNPEEVIKLGDDIFILDHRAMPTFLTSTGSNLSHLLSNEKARASRAVIAGFEELFRSAIKEILAQEAGAVERRRELKADLFEVLKNNRPMEYEAIEHADWLREVASAEQRITPEHFAERIAEHILVQFQEEFDDRMLSASGIPGKHTCRTPDDKIEFMKRRFQEVLTRDIGPMKIGPNQGVHGLLAELYGDEELLTKLATLRKIAQAKRIKSPQELQKLVNSLFSDTSKMQEYHSQLERRLERYLADKMLFLTDASKLDSLSRDEKLKKAQMLLKKRNLTPLETVLLDEASREFAGSLSDFEKIIIKVPSGSVTPDELLKHAQTLLTTPTHKLTSFENGFIQKSKAELSKLSDFEREFIEVSAFVGSGGKRTGVNVTDELRIHRMFRSQDNRQKIKAMLESVPEHIIPKKQKDWFLAAYHTSDMKRSIDLVERRQGLFRTAKEAIIRATQMLEDKTTGRVLFENVSSMDVNDAARKLGRSTAHNFLGELGLPRPPVRARQAILRWQPEDPFADKGQRRFHHQPGSTHDCLMGAVVKSLNR